MNRIATVVSLAAAFAAGCGVTYLFQPAWAAENITAQLIHTGEMQSDALRPANEVGYRSEMFRAADRATAWIQVGSVPKHWHPTTNEIQYILEGTGTIWLGDKEVTVKPGDLVIIPKGTPHGGTKPISGQVKAIA